MDFRESNKLLLIPVTLKAKMSLKVKCFATVIEAGSHPESFTSDSAEDDGHIEIHSTLYELVPRDFISLIFHQEKEVLSYTTAVTLGEDSEKKLLFLSKPIFTKYASKEKDKYPIPLINQPISLKKNESANFISSRFWAYKNYFFITNRHYSKAELGKVKMKIHYIVKQFDDELDFIADELKGIGIKYEN